MLRLNTVICCLTYADCEWALFGIVSLIFGSSAAGAARLYGFPGARCCQ